MIQKIFIKIVDKKLFVLILFFYFAVFLGFANQKEKAPLAGYKCRAATDIIY